MDFVIPGDDAPVALMLGRDVDGQVVLEARHSVHGKCVLLVVHTCGAITMARGVPPAFGFMLTKNETVVVTTD